MVRALRFGCVGFLLLLLLFFKVCLFCQGGGGNGKGSRQESLKQSMMWDSISEITT